MGEVVASRMGRVRYILKKSWGWEPSTYNEISMKKNLEINVDILSYFVADGLRKIKCWIRWQNGNKMGYIFFIQNSIMPSVAYRRLFANQL